MYVLEKDNNQSSARATCVIYLLNLFSLDIIRHVKLAFRKVSIIFKKEYLVVGGGTIEIKPFPYLTANRRILIPDKCWKITRP